MRTVIIHHSSHIGTQLFIHTLSKHVHCNPIKHICIIKMKKKKLPCYVCLPYVLWSIGWILFCRSIPETGFSTSWDVSPSGGRK